MDRVFIFLACLASFLVLCQWFVFAWTRKHLFQRYEPVSRRVAYAVLASIATLNFVALQFAVEASGAAGLESVQKVASVAYFSYLGIILSLSFFFAVLAILGLILRIADVLVSRVRPLLPGHGTFSSDERGFFERPRRRASRKSPELDSNPAEAARNSGQVAQEPTATTDRMQTSEDGSRIHLPTRRSFLKWGTAAALAVTVGEAGKGLVEAYQPPVVEEFDLLIPGLDLPVPLTLIQFTDFHYGQFLGDSELQRLVDMLNELEGDMVVITGDTFHSPISPIGQAPDILRTLRDRQFGNVTIMGNHDFYAGERRVVDALQAGGLTLLRNRWMTLNERGTRIHLGGIDDPMVNWVWGAKFPQFNAFMNKAPKGSGVRILLSHRPNILPLAGESGIDFVMAGHIHGGQIVIPLPGVQGGVSLASVASKFIHGWYQAGSCRMYLNRGAGLTFVPWRVNCPPEITVVHIRPGPGPVSSVKKIGGGKREA